MFRQDRALGRRLRDRIGRHRMLARAVRPAAGLMSPLFQVAVAAAIVDRRSRVTGLRMLLAGAAAAGLARVLRDRIGRTRPGERPEGGFPSRHAAAATAISATALARRPMLGLGLTAAAGVGSLARIASADHDPFDVVAGAALGLTVAHVVAFPLSALRAVVRLLRVR